MGEDGVVERRVRVLEDELLKKIGYDEEEVGRGWVPLPQPIFALNPFARDPVQKYCRFACVEKILYPTAEEK